VTISRANVATYLGEQFSSLATAVGQASYDPDINNAFRALGVAESDLATATIDDGSRLALFTLAEYYALLRFWRQLSDRANYSLGGNSLNFSNMLENIQALASEAATRCAALGYAVKGDSWAVGWLNLDWQEPSL
jgi:hypothetical protein